MLDKSTKSLLTGEGSLEYAEKQKKEQQAWDRADAAIEILLEAYSEGQLTFRRFCEMSERALRSRPEKGRHRMLGQAVESALKENPSKSGKTTSPDSIVDSSIKLVDMVCEREGLKRTLEPAGGDQSAFSKVAEILTECGMPRTARQVHDDYYYRRENIKKP